MLKIQMNTIVKASPDGVFQVITDFEKFPRYAKNVKEVKVINREGNKYRTRWSIDFDGAPFSWTEEVIVYEKTRSTVFKAIEGDFYIYCGEWKVTEKPKNTCLIEIEAYFNWGIPNMEKFIGKTFERKAKKAIKSLLLSFKRTVVSLNG